MDIDAVFLPLAEELIDEVFPTRVLYQRAADSTYDFATGAVAQPFTEYEVNAGVLSSGRQEQGGANEGRTLRLWIHHGDRGLPFLPRTADRVRYLEEWWKVTTVEPTFSSKAPIASKITLAKE